MTKTKGCGKEFEEERIVCGEPTKLVLLCGLNYNFCPSCTCPDCEKNHGFDCRVRVKQTISQKLNAEWNELTKNPKVDSPYYIMIIKSKAEQHKETCKEEIKWLDNIRYSSDNYYSSDDYNTFLKLENRVKHLKSEIYLLEGGTND